MVYINDSAIWEPSGTGQRPLDVPLRFSFNDEDVILEDISVQAALSPDEAAETDLLLTGFTSSFGVDLTARTTTSTSSKYSGSLSFSALGGMPLLREDDNRLGCEPFKKSYTGSVLMVHRGDCTFIHKIAMARDAGAVGVIVVSDEDMGINPTAEPEEVKTAGDLTGIALVMMTRTDGAAVEEMMTFVNDRGWGSVQVEVDLPEPEPVEERRNVQPQDVVDDTSRILYLNSHPLINTRLLM